MQSNMTMWDPKTNGRGTNQRLQFYPARPLVAAALAKPLSQAELMRRATLEAEMKDFGAVHARFAPSSSPPNDQEDKKMFKKDVKEVRHMDNNEQEHLEEEERRAHSTEEELDEDGVFLYNAMFNHDCNPNCVKFTPEGAGPEGGVSEVRVARPIAKGEQLTISYLYPREQSRENRQKNLWEQFGFKCCCELCKRGDSVLHPLPSATEDNDGTKPGMPDLEKVLVGAEEIIKTNPESAADALSVALETLSDALEIVAHDHLVFMRIHKLVADSCDLLLRGKTERVCEYSILFLRSSYELLELQRTYLNPDHIDLARTLNDVSQGIQLLLSYDPEVLLTEFPEWKNFRQASVVENQYRQEYRRLKRMYE
ncbi:hypothetical protein AM588_10002435 [Phytophthora nicotianae]|uniref:SET domain-containing protein n=1 Tax=Phytophthora nicotianae TaxID=4792 RepID=A0A0W8CZ46_PHYNI|nr:hypothetical protein AM588_10002435 [Phytophthora nicotianae]